MMINASDAHIDQIMGLIRTSLNIELDDPDLDLFDTGLADSLAVVMLIAAIEEWLAWVLPLEDFDLDNFRTARRLAEYLESTGAIVRSVP
jgi:D-alanine--poly(phosphoribitol) ligase subunit 2